MRNEKARFVDNLIFVTIVFASFVCEGSLAATFTYAYDSLNRLTNAAYSDGANEAYSYDDAGNRLSRITTAATAKVDVTPPSIPTNLVLRDLTSTKISVAWYRSRDTGGSGLAGYLVYINDTLATNTASTNLILASLNPDTQYCLTVAAYDRCTNISATSPPLCISTSSTNDTQPPLLSIIAPADGAVLYTNIIEIFGTSTDSGQGNNGIAAITVNGLQANGAISDGNATSRWSVLTPLSPGYNVVRVVAQDASPFQNQTTNDLNLIRGLTATERPIISSATLDFDGRLDMQFLAGSDLVWQIAVSTDLRTWVPLTNLLVTNWVTDLVIPDTANFPERFYRLQSPPQPVRRVIAWGNNTSGQTNVPSGLSNVVAIASAANGGHCLALNGDGTVVAWGNNSFGQTNVPADLTNVLAIACGGYHSMALKADRTVVAWGYNGFHQTNVPSGLTNVIGIAAGMDHSAALTADGRVVAWGYNGKGETNVPAGLTNVTVIAAGGENTLAVKSDRTVVVWGNNSYGQTNAQAGLTNIVAVACGNAQCLALRTDGSLFAWGFGGSGLADIPAGLTNVTAIACGFDHNLAVTADGNIVAWGLNGNGQITVPAVLSNAVAVAAGQYFSVALGTLAETP
jgi:YD repeat-containing protein